MEKRVHRLTRSVAERIAAGEVIERPASVVKELIENSLDAGATEIRVSLESGGKDLIEVLDNGHGMPPEDLALCIERHATSKLSEIEDLERISTLGFRGEALPSIAAVSDLTLISRSTSAETRGESAYELNISEPEPKAVTFGQFICSPHGTLIRARSLFSQIPARLKFLKSQSAEVAQVREWMERLAVGYPQVGFQLLSEGRSLLNLRPDTEPNRIHALLSDGNDYPLLTASNEQDGFRDRGFQVRVYWLQGLSAPHTRRLIQVVNRRAIRDRILQQALLAPFRQALLPGQFPALALLIEIHPAALDVNVHPTKTEVRFLDSRKVFHTVETIAQSLITQMGSPAFVPPIHSPSLSPSPSTLPLPSQTSWGLSESPPDPVWVQKHFPKDNTSLFPPPPKNSLLHARPVGIILNTYLIYEDTESLPPELILVDQHAAHERVRFEKLRSKVTDPSPSPASQALLIPEVVRFSPENTTQLKQRITWLEKWGFTAELFSEESLLFRSVPPEWGTRQLNIRLKNLVDRLLENSHEAPPMDPASTQGSLIDAVLFEALASEACHSAIRAGDPISLEEGEELVRQLFSCEHPWNCPHGRPTVVRIPERKIEEWFQRKL